MDSTKLHALGWRPRIGLDEGLRAAYAEFRAGGYASR
jgi:nucleoside-diphosphate-sugar epimerase